ncbi:MAG TPA: RNA methyltransferase [Thermoanaerobaculaceae bacterium]|nr:RNA methyltransferase [Thermoanaerobaculaceae bacterium]HPS76896.1 RNA methyltransferase [Thermoanaerobaculaceae bacterium]
MLRIESITKLDATALAPYRTMRRPVEHERQGIFVAEGGHVVRRLLESPLPVVSVLLSPTWLRALQPELTARTETIAVFVAPEAALAELVGFRLHQGVMAVGQVPPSPALDAALDAAPQPRLAVALDGVTNPENVGVILRTAASFEAAAVLVGETGASPWLRRAVRNSMGTVFRLALPGVESLRTSLHVLREQGFKLIAATPTGRPVWECDLGGACCVVLGHEGYGLRPEVEAACDLAAAIPMPPGVDSLNVASAAAVLLYEVRRQQRSCHGFDPVAGSVAAGS